MLCLPIRVEAHRVQVYLREGCEKCLQFVFEVVVRRYDVKEVFDDADVVVSPSLVRGRIYPRTGHSGHIVGDDGIDFVPYARMVAA